MRTTAWMTLAIVWGCSHGSSDAPTEPANDQDAAVDETTAGPTDAEIAKFERAKSDLLALMMEQKIPGASIAVVLHGKLAFAEGLGVKKEGTTDPVTPDSLFRVASMTKPIVATGIMQQVEAGTMDLDARLRKYLPKFTRSTGDADAVHLRHLLSHTSGVPDEGPYKCRTDPAYMSVWLNARNGDPLWSPPGRLFDYSNAGYALAAYALQEVTATPFTAYLKEHVLAKANMATATFEPAEASADRTFGHDRYTKKIVDFNYEDCAVMRGYMGIMASAKDYAHFTETVMANDGALVTYESLATMESPLAPTGYATDAMGLGLFDFDWRDTHVVSHDGRASGWESSMLMVPREGTAVIVLVNADAYSPVSFGLHVIDIFRDTVGPEPDYRTPVSTWGVYAGVYEDPFAWLGTVTVTKSSSGLHISIPAHAYEGTLAQVATDTFALDLTGSGNWLDGTFFKDPAGNSEYFATRNGVAKRTTATPAGGAGAAAFSGRPPTWAHAYAHQASLRVTSH